MEIMAGRGTENDGIYLDASHLGAKFVEEKFPGMVERVKDIGKDLARERVEITPTSHYQMGGVKIDTHCRSNLKGLLVAGEDTGGTHGANRLGGNGICESTVFGRRAGDMAAELALQENLQSYGEEQAEEIRTRWLKPFRLDSGKDIYSIREEMKNLMWDKVGLVRTGTEMEEAVRRLDEMVQDVEHAHVENRHLLRYNMEWQNIIDVTNSITVCRMVANSALHREESRGAHYREDFPETDNENWLVNIHLNRKGERGMEPTTKPVNLSRLKKKDLENLK
jgi:succinate dehydrogenase / fumarate reductase flavoprotein subunit/fumarate reductase flavoprotein subunit